MSAFYIPSTKKELIEYLAKHLALVKHGSLVKMPKKQLLAIYYRLRSRD